MLEYTTVGNSTNNTSNFSSLNESDKMPKEHPEKAEGSSQKHEIYKEENL